MILQNTKIDMLPLDALVVLPSALIFWLFLIGVHGGLLTLLQQLAHVMILDWRQRRENTNGHTLGPSQDPLLPACKYSVEAHSVRRCTGLLEGVR